MMRQATGANNPFTRLLWVVCPIGESPAKAAACPCEPVAGARPRPGEPPQRARGIKGEHLVNFYSILVKFPSNTRSLPLPGPPDLLQSGYRGEGDQATKRGHGVLELTFVTQLSDPSRGALEKEGSFCWGDPAIEWVDRELGRGDVF